MMRFIVEFDSLRAASEAIKAFGGKFLNLDGPDDAKDAAAQAAGRNPAPPYSESDVISRASVLYAAGRRPGLLRSMTVRYAGSLATYRSPRDQAFGDIAELRRAGRLTDDSYPLAVFLHNLETVEREHREMFS